MSRPVLTLHDVGKRFRRWVRRPQTLKETIVRRLAGRRPAVEDFWALRGVSLAVEPGEFLGICGANGAGKSTLLRVVARILPATEGSVHLRGRLATMLDLAAGFLPDYTGRENVYLNGAILGWSRAEMDRRMASIAAFADIGDFFDSPVRSYSSGMHMRLGFAVASHVEADLLLLDEVLAVGDVAFQEKCGAWLTDLKRRGVSALVVSHDPATLARVCDRVAWLDRGRVVDAGDPAAIAGRYEHDLRARSPR